MHPYGLVLGSTGLQWSSQIPGYSAYVLPLCTLYLVACLWDNVPWCDNDGLSAHTRPIVVAHVGTVLGSTG